jgi:SnoaL-like domain
MILTDIERLTIVDAVGQLKARYCRLADARMWAPFSELFMPDGSMKFYDAAGALASQAEGRPGIIEKLTLSVGSAQPIHHVFSGEIDVHSADMATAIWAMEDWIFRPAGSAPDHKSMHGFGHYHETYRRVDGQWLIATLELRRLKLDFF